MSKRVRVVTWACFNSYDDKVNQPVTVSGELWGMKTPEVINFRKQHKTQDSLRLEQLLGLPPDNGKKKNVEMWVRPADHFRPSADPGITASEAETFFLTLNAFIKVSDEFRKWFNNQKTQSYGANGYPWTRLGYIYDWGKNDNNIGMSEFVILPCTSVEINAITSTEEYGNGK
ncbi:hypothetical protein [Chlorobaculum limnaeum]|uniref:hypothetical protein n=1 Tax=Chlorobaculum limnaeum TaxID=274537 RepID=UPI001F431349|nr:hypothetical protein [Chlorobaculum limnaeum]